MKISFISLKLTRYSDKQSILTAFSRELGRVALAVPAGKGREAARLRALAMPMSVVECDTDVRPGREIMPLRQARQAMVMAGLHVNPLKQMLAMFLAEVVSAMVRDSGPDAGLYDFIESSVKCLDGNDGRGLGNFHICFLYHLGRMLGVEPDVSTYRPGWMLDMRDGAWRATMPIHGDALTPEESGLAARLARISFTNLSAFRFSRAERGRVLDLELRYLSLHVASLKGLRSLEVLRSMF